MACTTFTAGSGGNPTPTPGTGNGLAIFLGLVVAAVGIYYVTKNSKRKAKGVKN